MSTARYIRIHENDNVVTVADDGGLPAGTLLDNGITLKEAVPQGHKIALVDLSPGEEVRRYNVVIGHANTFIAQGAWVNEHRLDMPAAPELHALPVATNLTHLEPPQGYTFDGFRNPDSSVGTRNLLAISTSVQCVSGVVAHAVKRIREELLPKYPNVDDVISLEHVYGCGVAIQAPDAVIPIRTLRNIARNPNFGGRTLLVSLGCEKLQADVFFPDRFIPIKNGGFQRQDDHIALVTLQDDTNIGFDGMIRAIMEAAEEQLLVLNRRVRTTCPLSDLIVGVQCGGSDAFSGVTANPVVGFASDLLVRAGARVMFSEVTEVRDGIAQLTARAADAEIARQLIEQMDWYDRYLGRG